MIIRVPHRRQFTVVANQALQDRRLSFRATGILAYLLSLPEDSTISARKIGQVKAEGRDAVLNALLELEKVGYLRREKIQDLHTGRWATACTLAELPGNPPPSPEKPEPGEPGPENQDLSTKELETNTHGQQAFLENVTPSPMPAELRAYLPRKPDQDEEQSA